MNHLLTVCIFIAIGFVLCVKGFSGDKEKRKYLLLFIAIFAFDQLMASLPLIFPTIDLLGGKYNWTGKSLTTVFSVIIIFFLRNKFRNLDFTFSLKQVPGSLRLVLIVISVVTVIHIVSCYFTIPVMTATWEDHLFQLTLPGISEEVMFRGVLLGLLNGVFISRRNILGACLGWGTVVTAGLFGLMHGIWIDGNLHFHMNVFIIILPLFEGFLFAWIRERTKSLVIPIIYHNFLNEITNLVPLIK